MDKQPPNVILFDEDQPPRTSSHKPTSEIVSEEIRELTIKIKQLEKHAQELQMANNDSHINPKPQVSESHWQQLLLLIEKKIQIVVRETKKIVDKLSEGFDKKLQQKLSSKYEESGMAKVKQSYSESVKRIEQHYRGEIEKTSRQFREAEQKMLAKVNALEQQLNTRANQFSIKQKQYVDWIHHLEVQLEEKPKRKMIEVTQERVGRSSMATKGRTSEHGSFISSDHNPHIQPLRSVSPQENSKVVRKRKIFDNNKSSVSPNSKAPSQSVAQSLQSQPYFASNSSKVINPTFKTQLAQQKAPPAPSIVQAEPTISLASRATDPLKAQPQNQKEYSPWRVMESMERSGVEGTKRNQLVKQASEDEFYKDLPKASQGWEGFQDFKEYQESSGESDDEDVMFYRQSDKQEQFLDRAGGKPNEGKKGQEKVFSPFDL